MGKRKTTIYNDKGHPFSKWQPAEKFEYAWVERQMEGSTPVKELTFDRTRKWRWDFCWPDLKVAVEIDGFGYGHQAVAALSNNHEKQNAGIEQGWLILRFTARHFGSLAGVHDAVDQTLRVLIARATQKQELRKLRISHNQANRKK